MIDEKGRLFGKINIVDLIVSFSSSDMSPFTKEPELSDT